MTSPFLMPSSCRTCAEQCDLSEKCRKERSSDRESSPLLQIIARRPGNDVACASTTSMAKLNFSGARHGSLPCVSGIISNAGSVSGMPEFPSR